MKYIILILVLFLSGCYHSEDDKIYYHNFVAKQMQTLGTQHPGLSFHASYLFSVPVDIQIEYSATCDRKKQRGHIHYKCKDQSCKIISESRITCDSR